MFGLPPSSALAPLPPGWTEHVAPTGQPFYYNTLSNESTYIRPNPSFPPPPPNSILNAAPTKKEKPRYKIPVPDSPWIRVKTTHDNIFFTNSDTKESVWTTPEDIADVVASLDWDALEEDLARQKEVARLQKELERDSLKRKATPPPDDSRAPDADSPPPKKRKKPARVVDEAPVAIAEFAVDDGGVADADEEAGGEDEEEEEGSEAAFSTASAEEEWQREMAEGMAKLAAEEAAKAAGESIAPEAKPEQVAVDVDEPSQSDSKPFAVPNQVNLSHEEARTLFKTLLSDKNPNPLAPFSSVMPTLITDPRYVLLPNQNDRETAFNEWCRDAARRSRASKTQTAAPSSATEPSVEELDSSAPDPALAKQQARFAYDSLLASEVTSTRTTWDDFRRKWKRDRRFFGFGRDDREREKVFRAYLKDLGERKRAQAKKAELEFMELLKSHAGTIPITPNSEWKEVKRPLVKDPRYDAVGSSTLREELFGTFLKALTSGSLPSLAQPSTAIPSTTIAPKADLDRKARTEKALREREERARAEKGRVENVNARSKAALTGAEAESELMSFFVDNVREPTASYQELESVFEQHPRFASSPLPNAQKRALFHQHISHLRDKYLTSLHALFLSHSPLLSTKWSDLTADQLSSLDASLPATKLGLSSTAHGPSSLRRTWEDWNTQRTSTARADFQKLLEENSFIEFWGKIGKLDDANEADTKLVKPSEEDLEMSEMGGGPAVAKDEDEGEGRADLRTLAKNITENEVERVLKNDQRYRAFDHMPEERLRWVRDFLSSLSAPGRSVHVRAS